MGKIRVSSNTRAATTAMALHLSGAQENLAWSLYQLKNVFSVELSRYLNARRLKMLGFTAESLSDGLLILSRAFQYVEWILAREFESLHQGVKSLSAGGNLVKVVSGPFRRTA